MDITSKQFEKNFKGYQIVGCAVRSAQYLYFSLTEDYTQKTGLPAGEPPAENELRKRIVVLNRKEHGERRWTHFGLEGFENINAAVSVAPKNQFVGVDSGGGVYVVGAGVSGIEAEIGKALKGGTVRGSITRCRTIGGYVYVTGSGRSVGYREDKSKWISLTQGLPFVFKDDWKHAGFFDIDGFSQEDIYAAGGKGDIWHYNGSAWNQIDFQSNIHLYSICCGRDGAVYVGGQGGSVFKGRDNKWKQIYQGEMTIPFRQMVWHDDRVWATSDYGLWQIKEDKLETAIVDDEIRICSGYLSSANDTLLLAGYNGAALLENSNWEKLL